MQLPSFDAIEDSLATLSYGGTHEDLDDERLPTVATTAQDLQQAWRLVEGCYAAKGYSHNSDGLWYDPQVLDPRTTCLLTRQPSPATVSVVFDSPLRLPADVVFRDLLDPLRVQGRRLCEFTALAHAHPDREYDPGTISELFRHGWLVAAHLEDATDIMVTVHPHHVPFYRRCLLFERLGPVRNYGKVNDTPAVLMRLDLQTAPARYRERHGARGLGAFFLNDPRRGALLARLFRRRHAPDPWVLAYFCHQRRDLFVHLNTDQRTWVLDQHPGLRALISDPVMAEADVRDSARLLAVAG